VTGRDAHKVRGVFSFTSGQNFGFISKWVPYVTSNVRLYKYDIGSQHKNKNNFMWGLQEVGIVPIQAEPYSGFLVDFIK
jgi:hypothetical protein